MEQGNNKNNLIERRKKLCENVQPGLVILDSARECFYNHDCSYPYRQNSDLYYYCNIEQPNSTLVLEVKEDKTFESHMFVTVREPNLEIWTGKIFSHDEVKELFGIDHVYDNTEQEIKERLGKLFSQHKDKHLYFNCPNSTGKILKFIEENKTGYQTGNLLEITDDQRCVKDISEIELMRKAAKLSAQAHKLAMRATRTSKIEYELDALIIYHTMKNGSKRLAYPSIVASGNNATTLHYSKNNSVLKDGDLVLVDAGCEYQYYASDISRTWPVNGKFTDSQKEIYQLVLDAQKQCIEMVKPGITLYDIHLKSVEVITKGLISLGLLEGSVEDNIKERSTSIGKYKYTKYYMHSIGHWLGLDVHDCYSVSMKRTKLVPGHVFTIEPGIYISNDADVPDKYKGIGVRIEDDILVTATGYEVLSKDVPKEIDEIESLIQFT